MRSCSCLSMQINLCKCKHTNCTWPNSGPKHLPASVDSDWENVVVEALFDHAVDLCVCGDLSALQTLEAKQRDGGNWECLDRERLRFRTRQRKEYRARFYMSAFSPLARPWQSGWWSRADIPCWLNWGSLLQIRHTSSQSTVYSRGPPSWNTEKLIIRFFCWFAISHNISSLFAH